MDYLLSEESVSAIKTLLAGNESQRFRVYDVVAAAIKDSDSSFEFFRQEGIVDLLLKEGSAKDVLVAMNFYELVPTLCESSVPYEYIESAGVFKNVLEQVQQAKTDDSVTSSLLRLSALKLFSRMADAKGISPA
ncbi:26S proteasome non-ATPase regulatory subunit 5, partial [Coemansia sp. RSA 1797]